MSTDETFDRLVLGPSEGAKSMRMVGWALGAIACGAAAYVCVAVLSEPMPLFAAIGAGAALGCVIGLVAAARHLVWVDGAGITVQSLTDTHIPWGAVVSVRLDRRVVRAPQGYGDRYDFADGDPGEVIISHLVLVAEQRNGKRLTLPIRASEGTMTAAKAAELARVLDELRRASS